MSDPRLSRQQENADVNQSVSNVQRDSSSSASANPDVNNAQTNPQARGKHAYSAETNPKAHDAELIEQEPSDFSENSRSADKNEDNGTREIPNEDDRPKRYPAKDSIH